MCVSVDPQRVLGGPLARRVLGYLAPRARQLGSRRARAADVAWLRRRGGLSPRGLGRAGGLPWTFGSPGRGSRPWPRPRRPGLPRGALVRRLPVPPPASSWPAESALPTTRAHVRRPGTWQRRSGRTWSTPTCWPQPLSVDLTWILAHVPCRRRRWNPSAAPVITVFSGSELPCSGLGPSQPFDDPRAGSRRTAATASCWLLRPTATASWSATGSWSAWSLAVPRLPAAVLDSTADVITWRPLVSLAPVLPAPPRAHLFSAEDRCRTMLRARRRRAINKALFTSHGAADRLAVREPAEVLPVVVVLPDGTPSETPRPAGASAAGDGAPARPGTPGPFPLAIPPSRHHAKLDHAIPSS